MNEQEIRKNLESGRQHPFPLLQHLAREGDEQSARIVAEVGPEYLQGRDRLRFRGLVRELVPEALEVEEAERARRSRAKQEERSAAVGEHLKARAAAIRERREGRPVSSGSGWNLPPAV
ncbi:MAG: hypothetical protein M3R38_08120 [Actinomycetota bacterium]|nr:hypothetical protein [Actinomycetota bacterium]